MSPEHSELSSFISPIGLGFTLFLCLAYLLLPRRAALLPIAFITCYMTLGTRVVVSGLNFTMIRLLVLAGCIRLLLRWGEGRFVWLRVDTLTVLWVCSGVTAYTLLWMTSSAFVNRLGFAYDAIGLHFILRTLISDTDDIKRAIKLFAYCMIPLALCMSVEKLTGENPFFVFGGVPQYSAVREGIIRCQGSFAHPILAGSFGAAWFPLFGGLWRLGKGYQSAGLLGMAAATAITIQAGSSGPIGAYLAGALGLCLWPLRGRMRVVRWGLVGLLIGLQIVMSAPVWYVFARISILSGSTGWHRGFLIDRTFANFSEWWLIGTKSVARWGVWAGDVTNQYILQGVTGGFITMALFIAIVVWSFSTIGKGMKETKRGPWQEQWLIWSCGAALLSHAVTFMSVAYFDQNVVNWHLLIAMVAGISAQYVLPAKRRKVAPAVREEGMSLK
jgi:hypothetical protein